MKRNRKQQGFTLIGVMFATAIGAFVVIGMASSISAMFSAQTSVNASAEAQLLVDEIRRSVEDATSCASILAGAGATAAKQFNSTGPSNLDGVIMNLHGQARTIKLGVPNDVANGLQISELSLLPNTSVPPVDIPLELTAGTVTPARRWLATLKVRIDKTSKYATGKNIPPSYIPLQVYTAPTTGTTNIIACNNAPSAATICNDLTNHRWDPVTRECLPSNQCISGGSYSDAPDGNGGFVNPLTGSKSCPAGYETRRSGTVAAARGCGKRCVTNTFYASYECTKCYTGSGLTSAGSLTSGVAPQSSSFGVTDEDEATAESNFQTNANDIAALQAQIAALTAAAADSCKKIPAGSCCKVTLDSKGCGICSVPAPAPPASCPP